MRNFDAISGQYCDFKSPLSKEDFFAIPAESSLPEGVKPVIDASAGLCIGYLYGMNQIYHLYDIRGYYLSMYAFPPESVLFDPLDLLLVSGVAAEPDGQASFLMRNGATRIVSSGRAVLNTQIIPALKSRLAADSTEKIKYSPLAARAMADRNRYIPDYILDKTIKDGKRTKITTEKNGEMLFVCSLQIKKSGNNGQYQYINLNVIVDTNKNIIKEFNY
ncbi:hypothetical protein CKG00_01615 [Morganella morganii]|uniref:Uncharacterized protein n=1 Tax=Morganella morganii TaxID=582 RepID=A0A433ZT04_MORMO|nr:hypothetical protein [Morganella morganii]RUT65236.1 hypothetical protein CKG00_01615 [Morganella morganii]